MDYIGWVKIAESEHECELITDLLFHSQLKGINVIAKVSAKHAKVTDYHLQ